MIFNRFALREIRTVCGLSQVALGRADSRSPSYISELESGDRDRPTIDTLVLLADPMGVDARAFYVDPPVDRLIEELVLKIDDDKSAKAEAAKALRGLVS